MAGVNGYEFADKVAEVLGLPHLDTGDANQILDATHRISDASERKAVPISSYLIGLADVSPSSFGQYVDMVADRARNREWDEDPWTGYQFAEEMATTLGRSQLTFSECDQILDNLQEAAMVSEPLAVPLICYLCGRANLSPSEVGQKIGQAVRER